MKKIPIKAYFCSILISTAIVTAIYALSFIFAFDTPIAYFSTNSPLPNISKYLLLCIIAWTLSIFVFIPKNSLTQNQPSISLASKIASGLAATSFLFCAISKLLSPPLSTLSIIVTVLSFLSSAYFICNVIAPSQNNLRAVLGISVILWATASMSEAYINRFVTMNNPVKILLMLSMMSIMFFMLYEIKYSVSKPMPRAYAASILISICISCTFAVSFLIICVSGIYVVKEFLSTAVVSLTMVFYNICKGRDFLSAQEITNIPEQQ